ncbi:WxL protein host-binding domain-containing protein [Bacillus salitolerans]|uniref:WxL protein host-binding domain-containing protein n=1 Tax=Bacillus salitolerans TaxID=1437434 RepID=A0ABW4LWN9_9BACI
MKHLLLCLILLAFMFISYPIISVYAEENNFEFRVEPIFPDSQIGNKGYYHFKGTPHDTVTLQARIINDSEQNLNVIIRSLNAYSGNQGILYQTEPVLKGTEIINESFQFQKIATTPTEVTLEPLQSELVEFTLNIPNINGTLLGSVEFRVFKGTKELTQKEENSQLLIDQYKAINIGVQIDVTDYNETPSMELDKPFFSPEQIAIMVPMENSYPVIVPNISGTYKITKNEDTTFSMTGEIPSFKMAPMTTFHYPIRWSEGTLEPGTYDVSLSLDVNGSTQSYEQTISIENNEVQKTQEKMEERGEVAIAPKTFPWTTIMIVLFIIVLILIWMIKKPKSKRKDRKYPGQNPNDSY